MDIGNNGMVPYQEDVDFVKNILNNDRGAWESFVKKYSSNIFLRAKSWTKKSTYKPEQDTRIIKQPGSNQTITYTDETVDIYLWIFEQLKNNKLKYYRGIAPLEHYINSILADNRFMIDGIRKIKGQIKLPNCLKHMSETYQKIFTYMTQNKHEGQIASTLNISYETVIDIQNEIKGILQKNSMEYMVSRPTMSEYNDEISYDENEQKIFILENEIEVKHLIKRVINKLDTEEKVILKLYYADQLSYKEILDSYIEINRVLPGNIDPKSIKENDLINILDRILDKFINLLKKKYNSLEKVKDLKQISEYLLVKIGTIY